MVCYSQKFIIVVGYSQKFIIITCFNGEHHCNLHSCYIVVKIGVRHPDPVVETSSLSSVAPPDVWYDLNIPEHVSRLS